MFGSNIKKIPCNQFQIQFLGHIAYKNINSKSIPVKENFELTLQSCNFLQQDAMKILFTFFTNIKLCPWFEQPSSNFAVRIEKYFITFFRNKYGKLVKTNSISLKFSKIACNQYNVQSVRIIQLYSILDVTCTYGERSTSICWHCNNHFVVFPNALCLNGF